MRLQLCPHCGRPMHRYVSTHTAADQLGLSRRHVRRLLDEGALRGYRSGSRWLVCQDSIADYIRRQDPHHDPLAEAYDREVATRCPVPGAS